MDIFFMLPTHLSTKFISLYNYLTEINKKTSDHRTNPKGSCIFLSTAESTNMAFKFALTAHTMLMNSQKTTSISITNTQTHYRNPEKSKVFSLGTKKAISLNSP